MAPGDLGPAQRFVEAVRREPRYFGQHASAIELRQGAAIRTDRAVDLYGRLLNWQHLNPTADPRPHHLAADGKNWDPSRGVPVSTGALPGALPYCGCEWGPPRRGAEMLV